MLATASCWTGPTSWVGVGREVVEEALGLGDEVDLVEAERLEPVLPRREERRQVVAERRDARDERRDRLGEGVRDEDDDQDDRADERWRRRGRPRRSAAGPGRARVRPATTGLRMNASSQARKKTRMMSPKAKKTVAAMLDRDHRRGRSCRGRGRPSASAAADRSGSASSGSTSAHGPALRTERGGAPPLGGHGRPRLHLRDASPVRRQRPGSRPAAPGAKDPASALAQAHPLADLVHRGLRHRGEPVGAGLEDPVDLVAGGPSARRSAPGPARSGGRSARRGASSCRRSRSGPSARPPRAPRSRRRRTAGAGRRCRPPAGRDRSA